MIVIRKRKNTFRTEFKLKFLKELNFSKIQRSLLILVKIAQYILHICINALFKFVHHGVKSGKNESCLEQVH